MLVLGAEHCALRSARRDEEAEEEEDAEKHASAEHMQVDDVGGGPEQRLQLELLFMSHHVSGSYQNFAGLHLVEHGLHSGQHVGIALIGHFLVHGQRGDDHERHDFLQDDLGALVQAGFLAELAAQSHLEHAQVGEAASLRAKDFGAAVEVAHDGGVVRIGELAHIPDDAVGKPGLHPGYELVQHVFLDLRRSEGAEGRAGNVGKVAFVEAEAHDLQTGIVKAALVDVVQKAEAFLPEAVQCNDDAAAFIKQ